jgi:hypothetical protein
VVFSPVAGFLLHEPALSMILHTSLSRSRSS